MSKYEIDKTTVMTGLAYFFGIKGFRLGEPYEMIKRISIWTDEFIEKCNKDEIFYIYDCLQEVHKFARNKIQSHTTEVKYKCPRCKKEKILWQTNYVLHIYCPECHYLFDDDKSYEILEKVVQVDGFVDLYIRPYGIHTRTKKNPYLLARKTLSILTGIEERNFGTIKDPYDDMDTTLYENDYGVYTDKGCSFKPSKKLAQALYDKDNIDYRDGWKIVDYNNGVLYIDLTEQAWEELHPYYTPLIIGNCSKK